MKIKDLFEIRTGGDLWLDKEEIGNIPVVSLSHENNGVVGYIKKNISHRIYPKNSITVSGWAGGLKAFFQSHAFYVRGRVKILIPKGNLTRKEIFYYCIAIDSNAYRFLYGRKSSANRFSDIELPSEIPDWVYSIDLNKYKHQIVTRIKSKQLNLNIQNWKEFKIGDLFQVSRGKRILKNIDYNLYKDDKYKYPVITSTTQNNSVDGYYDRYNCEGNVLVCGGEASGLFTTYQENKCWIMDSARVFETNITLNKYIGLFLSTIFSMNQYRYSYGRKANPKEIENLIIRLPENNGQPDWQFMENYIKQLPYSDLI